MAMLAEKKHKQKWSHDPRNTAWSNDTNRFGYQMLEKMGWQSGKGLGAKEDGGTKHVKVSKKNNSLGLGADKYHDDNWLAHQDDFNDLLAKLNNVAESGQGGKSSKSAHETEKKARASKKRVFYQRFVKNKDLSGYSAEDMACIMGQRSKSAPATPTEQSEDEDSDDSCASCPVTSDPIQCSLSGVTTVTAKESVHDYFAKKMAEIKARRAAANSSDNSTQEEEKMDTKYADSNLLHGPNSENLEKTKKKRKGVCEFEMSEKQSNSSSFENERSSKKKKKKDKEIVIIDTDETERPGHGTNSSDKESGTFSKDNDAMKSPKKRKKKSKGKKKPERIISSNELDNDGVENSIENAKRKRKSKKREDDREGSQLKKKKVELYVEAQEKEGDCEKKRKKSGESVTELQDIESDDNTDRKKKSKKKKSSSKKTKPNAVDYPDSKDVSELKSKKNKKHRN